MTERKLLVVEDDVAIAEALAIYGRKNGFNVFVVYDGLEAVKVAAQERPQVILLDISLPGMDGRDVMVRLKRNGVANSSMVIFVTARDSQEDRMTALDLGAADYETKPLHFQLLFQKIDRLLKKRQATI